MGNVELFKSKVSERYDYKFGANENTGLADHTLMVEYTKYSFTRERFSQEGLKIFCFGDIDKRTTHYFEGKITYEVSSLKPKVEVKNKKQFPEGLEEKLSEFPEHVRNAWRKFKEK